MRKLTVTMCAAAGFVCIAGALALAGGDNGPETFRQLIAKRPAPKLEGLAERASPDQQGDAATESFWDLLKLRDQPVPAAVPELAKILAAHEGSTRIHRFAAAQALFAIDDDGTRRLLEKHLLAPEYPADAAVTYSAHWEMPEPLRSEFIAKYLLRDLADDLAVSVEARWPDAEKNRKAVKRAGRPEKAPAAGAQLIVTVKLINESPRALAVHVAQQFQAMALHFRGPSGNFAPRGQFVVYGPDPGRFARLKPGESTAFDVSLEIKTDAATLAKTEKVMKNGAGIKGFLESSDTRFSLSELGRYQLSAMIVRTPLADEQKKALRAREGIEAQEIWMGRAVSKPVEVELSSGAGETE